MKKIIQLNFYLNKETIKTYFLTGILTLSSYIIFPFLAVYFSNKDFSVAQVGGILGISSFSTSFCGITSPFFEKKLGVKKALFWGITIIAFCYLSFSFTNSYVFILLIVIFQGLGQGIVNPLLKKIIALYNIGNENTAFRYRYIILCIAIIVGPLIGNLLYPLGVDIMLGIVAVSCMISCLLLSKLNIEKEENNEKKYVSSKYIINSSICIFVIWSILVFTVFSVFENVTPLAIQPYNQRPETIFSIMIIFNSVLAIILQPVIIFFNERLDLKYQIIIGSLAFFCSYILFAYSKGNFFPLLFATSIFTIGEAFLIPMLDIIISRIAKGTQLTGFFAISEIKQLGFFIGPVVSTMLIQFYSVYIMYWLIAIICLFVLVLALILLRNIDNDK